MARSSGTSVSDGAATSLSRRSASRSRSSARTCESEWGSRGICGGNAVVVVSRQGCCMSHVATGLLYSLGANPRVVEIVGSDPAQEQLLLADEAKEEEEQVMPAIFIGGRLLGSVDRLLAAHISGSLVPQLKEAGALWL